VLQANIHAGSQVLQPIVEPQGPSPYSLTLQQEEITLALVIEFTVYVLCELSP
jgi:hypothetical protein